MNLDLSVVIINWNVRDLLRCCLRSAEQSSHQPATKPISTEFIVVDNASTDGSVEMLRAEFPHVILIANLDAEAEIARTALPEQALRTASAFGTLLRVFAGSGDRLWTPRPSCPSLL